MALETNELFSEQTRAAFPRIDPVHVYSKKLSAITGAPELAVGTPMAFDTAADDWVPWVDGGANGTGTIRAFVYPDAIATSATEEVLGQLMVAGTIHGADVVDRYADQATLDAALKAGLSERSLYVTGLAGTY